MNQEQTPAQTPEATNNNKNGRRGITIALIILIIAAAGFVYWLLGRGWESTDDAQVEGDMVPITSRVSGYVARVNVDDNFVVQPNYVLVQLDRKDFIARLRSAQANLSSLIAQAAATNSQLSLTQKAAPAGAEAAKAQAVAAGSGVSASATQIAAAQAQSAAAKASAQAALEAIASAKSDIATADAQIDSAKAAVQATQANVSSAKAQATKAASDATRYSQLYSQGAASKQLLESAQATSTSAEAALEASREQVNSAKAALAQAKSRRAAAQSALQQAVARAKAANAAASQAAAGVAAARAGLSESQARLVGANASAAGAATAPQQVAVGQAQNRAAAAKINQARADVRNASLQLSYTTITAPVSGIVSQKSVQPGQFLTPGQMLMSVVPLSNTWIIANFKETQLTDMRVGQPAEIEVDAYPGRKFHGRVQSIGAATGAQFSLLPPQNATGNYVKVVQRIPVKIVLDKPLPQGVVLRQGMNVTASVDMRGRN